GRALVADGANGGFFADPDGGSRLVRVAPPDLHVYGLGERTGPLDRRGRLLTFWNTDAYDTALGGFAPEEDPLYLSIPFFVGLRRGAAFGVMTHDARRLEMD